MGWKMKAAELINKVKDEITDPNLIIKTLEYNIFGADIPMKKWSRTNQIIALMYGHTDARSYNAWKSINRTVKKGEKAFYIIKPYTFKDKETGEVTLRFGTQAEFGYIQTEGEVPPEYNKVEEKAIVYPDVYKIADMLGVEIVKDVSRTGEAASYNNTTKTIRITSDDPNAVFHELSHAIDHAVNENLGTIAEKEIVAEFSSAVLSMYYKVDNDMGVSKGYLEYFSEGNLVHKLNILLPRIENVIKYVVDANDTVLQKVS